MDLTGFEDAVADVVAALPTVGVALASVAVAGLAVRLGVRWIKGIKSAI